MRHSLSLVLALCLVACGDEPTLAPDAGSSDAGSDAGRIRIDGGPDPDFVTVDFGPDPLPVGEERTVCVILPAGNEVARQVRAIRTSLPQGSHHMIVYRTDEPIREEPYPCFPFADGGQAVFIAETVEAELVYPPEAALAFEADQHVRLEIHQVNYLAVPIDITASVTFDFYPASEPPHLPVQFLFTGDMGLTLPPHETTTVTSFHDVPEGARIFALTSHTHSLGTFASIHRGRSETEFDATALHEADNWAEPPLDTFDPELQLGPGEGLRLLCEYMNDREETVGFGLGFEDEMCFLWAYYY